MSAVLVRGGARPRHTQHAARLAPRRARAPAENTQRDLLAHKPSSGAVKAVAVTQVLCAPHPSFTRPRCPFACGQAPALHCFTHQCGCVCAPQVPERSGHRAWPPWRCVAGERQRCGASSAAALAALCVPRRSPCTAQALGGSRTAAAIMRTPPLTPPTSPSKAATTASSTAPTPSRAQAATPKQQAQPRAGAALAGARASPQASFPARA